jgi:hypothetical protein
MSFPDEFNRQPEPSVPLPVEHLSLPAPLGQIVDLPAFAVLEGEAYVLFFDQRSLDPQKFFDAIVTEQVNIPCQLLFVPVLRDSTAPAVAMAAFEDVANWVDAVRMAAQTP